MTIILHNHTMNKNKTEHYHKYPQSGNRFNINTEYDSSIYF